MLKIRLPRPGRKTRPSYRVVVAVARGALDGRRIAELGYYDPLTDPSTVRLDVAATEDWIRKGAQPTDRVRKLLEIAKNTPQPPAAAAGPSA
ncbi:MAG: 30S ribosomal protein S16 [Chloroflexota bacterium]|nr:30S ribosomal protein S16 [Chloroflexota bacterium]